MQTKSRFTLGLRSTAASVVALSLVATLPGLAQDANPSAPPPAPSVTTPAAPAPSGGWRKFQPQDQNPPDQVDQGAPDPSAAPEPIPPPPAPGGDQQGQYPPQAQGPAPSPYAQQGPAQPAYVPTTITLPANTWVTVRLNEPLSSDRNQTGDRFTGTLLEPIIANGLLIARRGQTVTGIVTEAQKAGRVSGVSHLKLELTGIQLADGRQIQVKTQLINRKGDTSHGRDAFAIGATTATGAAIGAAVNGGVGAGIGAAAGLVVSTIGVLVTRGYPTVVYPETPLTFSMQTPIVVDNSQQAFHFAQQYDYNARGAAPMGPRPGYGSAYGPGPYGAPAPYYGGYAPYPYAYGYPYPYFYGPSVYFGYGGRWGYRGRWR
jgi:hypothetical protein